MAPRAEPSLYAIARHCEREEYPLTTVLRDTIPSRADPFDGEFDECIAMKIR